jgi:hypothetical protein
MIGFIDPSLQLHLFTINTTRTYKLSLIYTLSSSPLHTLGFSVSTSRLVATDLNTGTITSYYYKVFLSFLLQSLWNAKPILHSNSPVSALHGTNLYSINLVESLSTIFHYPFLGKGFIT